jgi:HAE1 family hydrophobic/amphiphilic exporter-1
MILASILAILFIFLVLASLYESFVTPLTIMLVLPLAACGAFIALFAFGTTLDIFSMIGCIMLLGVATKNSILLVDYTKQMVAQGMNEADAIIKAGRTRLRPILMTTGALIAGMLPIAIGLNEASRQRTSMGVGVIGGLVSSTLLTLVVVPAAYSYIERFRVWSSNLAKAVFAPKVRGKTVVVDAEAELLEDGSGGKNRKSKVSPEATA